MWENPIDVWHCSFTFHIAIYIIISQPLKLQKKKNSMSFCPGNLSYQDMKQQEFKRHRQNISLTSVLSSLWENINKLLQTSFKGQTQTCKSHDLHNKDKRYHLHW
jgi:hypothetical protein